MCFVQFDNVNVYYGKDFKTKYKAPTDFCFVLKVRLRIDSAPLKATRPFSVDGINIEAETPVTADNAPHTALLSERGGPA